MENSSGREEEVEDDRVSGSSIYVCVWVGRGEGSLVLNKNSIATMYYELYVISNLVGSYCC